MLRIPTLDDVKNAAELLSGKINKTELLYSTTFSRMFGCDLFFKMENHQKTGSFKARGALTKMSKLTQEEKERGVITASSGNHAQGVAYAAFVNRVDAKIVMPQYSVPAKVTAVQGYGAKIVLKGNDYSEAKTYADEIAKEEKRVFIEAFNDPYVIAGQGTVGLEIMQERSDIDTIIVPVGGGGLISGIAIAAKGIKPSVKIIGVESELSDSMLRSIEEGRIIPHTSGDSIADGISVKYPGELTFEVARKYVDQIVTVSDEAIGYAIYKLLERSKTVVEPSGAAGLAAILDGKIDVKGRKVAVVLSGG
ncbi:MAG: threonine ammonia-lyase, partial [Thermoplasmataceae archaeon]